MSLKKVKNTVPWTCVSNDLNGEEIIGTFYEKELQKKKVKKNLESKKYSRKKVIKYMLNGKDMITHSIVGLIKKN